jgi:hypothetical protein
MANAYQLNSAACSSRFQVCPQTPAVTARTVQGWPASGPGRLRPRPCPLTGVFAETPSESSRNEDVADARVYSRPCMSFQNPASALSSQRKLLRRPPCRHRGTYRRI